MERSLVPRENQVCKYILDVPQGARYIHYAPSSSEVACVLRVIVSHQSLHYHNRFSETIARRPAKVELELSLVSE